MTATANIVRAIRVGVSARRALRGPLRPSWDEEFESWATLFHNYSRMALLMPVRAQRETMASRVAATDLVRRTRYDKVDADGVTVQWARHRRLSKDHVLLYFHGGGYCLGSVDTHRDILARLCRASGMTGLAVDYRLAPEHRYPAAVDDAVTAYRWLLEKGYEPSRVAVAGDSAGGGLAMALLMRLRDEGHPLPAVGAFMSSWFDLQVTGASVERNEPFDYVSRASLRGFARHYLGATTEPGEPYASPLFGRFEGLPPMMLQAGEAEALLDDSVRVAERAKDAGVEVTLEVEDDMIHAYQAFAERFPVGQRAIDRLGAFIRGRVNLPVAASDGKAEAETDSPAGS